MCGGIRDDVLSLLKSINSRAEKGQPILDATTTAKWAALRDKMEGAWTELVRLGDVLIDLPLHLLAQHAAQEVVGKAGGRVAPVGQAQRAAGGAGQQVQRAASAGGQARALHLRDLDHSGGW